MVVRTFYDCQGCYEYDRGKDSGHGVCRNNTELTVFSDPCYKFFFDFYYVIETRLHAPATHTNSHYDITVLIQTYKIQIKQTV